MPSEIPSELLWEINDERYLNSAHRILNNSDLEINSQKSKINEVKEENKNNHMILNNNEHQMNDNFSDIDSDIYEHNNNMNKYYRLVKLLKEEELIFVKDYYKQKISEENKKFLFWLQKIFRKKYERNNINYLNRINIKNNIEIPDYPEIIKDLKNNLFECSNYKCNSIIYLSDSQRKLFNKIPGLYLEQEYSEFLTGYEKTRCPLCLKYKCKYCNKLSTLKSSLCCPFQAFKACYDTKVDEYEIICHALALYTPFIRVYFFGFMTNFPFFRALTKANKLSKNLVDILRNMSNHNYISFWTYQSELRRYGGLKIYNIFHISGSIFWTFSYAIILEEILIVFMAISFIFKKEIFKKFLNCYYLFCLIPGSYRQYGRIIVK